MEALQTDNFDGTNHNHLAITWWRCTKKAKFMEYSERQQIKVDTSNYLFISGKITSISELAIINKWKLGGAESEFFNY